MLTIKSFIFYIFLLFKNYCPFRLKYTTYRIEERYRFYLSVRHLIKRFSVDFVTLCTNTICIGKY